jgi:hypothetical protein
MSPTDPIPSGQQLFRIEKGSPAPEELAALAAVLLSRAAPADDGPGGPSGPRRAVAPWRRPERARGFDGPRSWQGAGR